MSGRRKAALHYTALILIIILAYAYFVPPPSPENFGTNNSVRFYLTKSLVLDRSFTIEKYYRLGIDTAFYAGHYYSGKAPCASFLAVPVYWAVWRVSEGRYTIPDWVYLYLVRLAVVSLPGVLLALLLHGFLRRFGVTGYLTDLLVIGYCLGTMAFPYSTQFIGHQLAAVLLFSCFMVLLRWRRKGRKNAALLSGGGLLGGLAVAADYPAALILAIIFLFMVFSKRRFQDTLIFAMGCVPGAFLIMLYNYACFGDPLSFPYAHEAMPIAREVQSQGLFGIRIPRIIPFLKLLFSPWRGIFFVSPFLVLVIPGLYSLATTARRDEGLERSLGIGGSNLFWLCLLTVLGYLLFNSSYGAWSGGAGYGPRFLVPALPFFMVPIAALMVRRPRVYGWLLGILVIYSVAFHLIGTAGGALAHEYLRNPVREFLLPSVLRGNLRPNWGTLAGLPRGASIFPFLALLAAGTALFFATGGGRVSRPVPRFSAADKLLLCFCCLVSVAMVGLFVFHKTDETAYRYAVIGHSYDVAGDDSEAAGFFERSLGMEPGNTLVLNDLTRILVEREEYRKALEINMRAISARPGRGREINSLMAVCDTTDRIGASPENPALYLERAELLEKIGCAGAAGRDRRRAASLIDSGGDR